MVRFALISMPYRGADKLAFIIATSSNASCNDKQSSLKGKTMTKKNYILLAEAMERSRPMDHWDANKRTQWALDVRHLCAVLRTDNPKFNADTFIKACGGIHEA